MKSTTTVSKSSDSSRFCGEDRSPSTTLARSCRGAHGVERSKSARAPYQEALRFTAISIPYVGRRTALSDPEVPCCGRKYPTRGANETSQPSGCSALAAFSGGACADPPIGEVALTIDAAMISMASRTSFMRQLLGLTAPVPAGKHRLR